MAADDDGAIAIGPFGSSMKADVYTATGVPVVRGNNLKGQPGFYGDLVFVPKEVAARFARCVVRPGDLVFPHRGAIGEVGLVTSQGYDEWMLSTSMMKLRTHPEKLDPHFAFYYFRSPVGRHQLLRNASQVGTPGISQPLASLRACEIVLPPLRKQREIVEVLQALDHKIEQNHRTGRALEGLARATFKAWFVDFEPVKAKAAGQTSFPGMPPAVFAALPDRLTDSPLGPVPQGWEGGTMGEIGQQRREQAIPGDVNAETPYVGLEHMPRRDLTLSTWGTAASVTSSKFRFHRGDILFGKLRPYFHKVGPAPVDGVCSTDIVVLHPTRPEYAAWLLMLVSGDDFVAHTDRSSAGTKMPRTNWKDMAAFPVALPPPPVAAAYQGQVGPMLDMIRVGIHDSSQLFALRDYLLPQLLNGRVRVRPSLAEAKA
ncbi:restriction endonuclease subunit S [Burkholderia pseudomallei]|uniref:restriction endonuclease subunit S n=1 Tax=Burkholderia pseudomallei TaxID=28450 RepID=UPI0012B16AD6|nr:restriction endonuclease subunit S [Burkholderia pseudomallei]